MALIEQTFERMEARAAELSSGRAVELESVGYQLHNVYNAVEDLFVIVARHFENNIADMSSWHTALLQRMAHAVEGVRPALITTETHQLLAPLRSFRHFFRHADVAVIEQPQLEINLHKARAVRLSLQQDVEHFLAQL